MEKNITAALIAAFSADKASCHSFVSFLVAAED